MSFKKFVDLEKAVLKEGKGDDDQDVLTTQDVAKIKSVLSKQYDLQVTSVGPARGSGENTVSFSGVVKFSGAMSLWFKNGEFDILIAKNKETGKMASHSYSISYTHPDGGSNGVTSRQSWLVLDGDRLLGMDGVKAYKWWCGK